MHLKKGLKSGGKQLKANEGVYILMDYLLPLFAESEPSHILLS